MKPVLSLLILSAAALSSSAFAAGEAPRGICRQDVQTFCSGVQPGGGRIIDCLEDHFRGVSQDCYNALQKIEAHRQQHDDGNESSPPPQGEHGPAANEPPPHAGDNDSPN